MPTNHLKIVEQWLTQRSAPTETCICGFPFVTIARDTGAGSHELCDTLLNDFREESSDLFRGWHVFDRLICEAIAEDPKIKGTLEYLVKERCESEFQDLMETWIAGTTGRYGLYKKTFQLIGMLATIGKVIIVGRAACCVTAPLKSGIHVRLVAPEPQRAAVTMKRLKVSLEEAQAVMRKKETERRRLLKTFFSQDVADPLLYDATWNTARVGMKNISASIIQLIKQHAADESE